MAKRVVIAGAGGFGRGVYAWIRQSSRHLEHHQIDKIVFIDDAVPESERVLPVVGTIRDYSPQLRDEVLVAVGAPKQRTQIVRHLEARGVHFHTFIDDRVILGDNVQIGKGTIICPGTVISADASLGAHVHINFNCSVGHDVVIGGFTTLSPMANIMGETLIGSEVFIGGSAVVMPRIEITGKATIGAGAIVTKTVNDTSTLVGNPARQLASVQRLVSDK